MTAREDEISLATAFERLLTIGSGCAVDETGEVVRLPVDRWLQDADKVDHRLFIDRCEGPTLDVGCGPGRLLMALAQTGVPPLGIDLSAAAIRQALARGAIALQRDVFDNLPGVGGWHHVLLADGNIGIAGDPARLIRRVAAIVRPGGSVHVELCGVDGGVITQRLRLRVGGQLSKPFRWATVAADAISDLAVCGGLVVHQVEQVADRWVATLRRPHLDGKAVSNGAEAL